MGDVGGARVTYRATPPIEAVGDQKNDGLTQADKPVEPTNASGVVADGVGIAPADRVFASVRDAALEVLVAPMSAKEFASTLDVSLAQAKTWLDRLVSAGAVTKAGRPMRYARKQSDLLGS